MGLQLIARSVAAGAALVTMSVAGVAGAAAPATVDWPGESPAVVADDAGALGGNISGLATNGTDALWAVRDAPAALLALDRSGARWAARAGWGDGRSLRYPDGHAGPDAEAVTTVDGDPGAVYVGAERDNATASRSRNSVLRYDTAGTGALVATREWRLDDVVDAEGSNTGLEGLAWVPDHVLVGAGLRHADGQRYVPGEHPAHHDGLFVVAMEERDELVLVLLADNGDVVPITTVKVALSTVMELHWDAEHGELWALCDDTCDGRAEVLVPREGTFATVASVRPPTGSARLNDEGFARLACAGGTSLAVWADDLATGGHVLRTSRLACTAMAELGAAAAPSPTVTSAATPRATTPSTTAPSTTASAGTGARPAAGDHDDDVDPGAGRVVIVGVAAIGIGVLAAGGAFIRRRRRRV